MVRENVIRNCSRPDYLVKMLFLRGRNQVIGFRRVLQMTMVLLTFPKRKVNLTEG
jgi:hypothetical protein